MQLQQSSVKRGGVTSPYWYGGTQDISASSAAEGGLCFRFTLPSKGGGDTQIELTVAPEDLRALLKKLAAEHPREAGMLAECTHTAVSALLSLQSEQK